MVQETIFDGSGQIASRSDFAYDEYASSPLLDRPGIIQHDSSFGTANGIRGNVTTITRYSDAATPSGAVLVKHSYDIAGNIVSTRDPNGNSTSFDYTDNFSDGVNRSTFAYLTRVDLPNTATAGVTVTHSEQTRYYYHTGLVQSQTDENGQATSFTYDLMGRLTSITRPDGGMITFSYNDVVGSLFSQEVMKINATTNHTITRRFDQLGRQFRIETSDPEGTVFIDTRFDALGRVSQTSNPYRSGTPVWTTNSYDALSRITSITTPDSQKVTTLYSGNATVVNDQAGRKRRSEGDALGRLVRVCENDDCLNLETSYTYDALDNLTGVSQRVQSRSFSYDNLGRLTSATNPESGTTTFRYDGNGNLISKTDARSITTSFSYDELNRLRSKSYTDTTTARVDYLYDLSPSGSVVPNGKGKRTASISGGIASEALSFDPVGRVLSERTTIEGIEFSTRYSYDLAGNIIEMTYPSGKIVKFAYGTANRLDNVAGMAPLRNEVESAYFADLNYAPHGAMSFIAYGNGLKEDRFYNSRLQPDRYTLSDNRILNFSLSYTLCQSGNNGNVCRITDSAQGKTYEFEYDELDRLKKALRKVSGSITAEWVHSYSYDRFGNLTGNGAGLSLTVDQATNRITNAGFSYDGAGNLVSDGTQSYSYDAEGRLVGVNGGVVAEYRYDGDNRRVLKIASNVKTFFIYDQAGNLISEYEAPSGVALSPMPEQAARGNGLVSYIHVDHLGTPRAVTDEVGRLKERRDYFPFGEEITATANNQPKFTGKVRDAESNLDYFGARYYASSLGRFMTVDPSRESVDEDNPQSWNRYSYAFNNPLKFVDPDGEAGMLAALAALAARIAATPTGQRVINLVQTQGAGLFNAATKFFNSPAGQEIVQTAAEIATNTQLPRAFPLGFATAEQFESAARGIKAALGAKDAIIGIRGSSVTGVRFRTGELVTAEQVKDFDFFAVSDSLVEQIGGQKALEKGFVQLSIKTEKFARQLTEQFPQLKELLERIKKETGRPASVRIFTNKRFKKDVKKEETIIIE